MSSEEPACRVSSRRKPYVRRPVRRRGVGGKNPFSLQYLISQNISKYYILIPFSLPRPVVSATDDPACHLGGLSESRSGDCRTGSRFHFGDSEYSCAGAVFKAAKGAGLAVPFPHVSRGVFGLLSYVSRGVFLLFSNVSGPALPSTCWLRLERSIPPFPRLVGI